MNHRPSTLLVYKLIIRLRRQGRCRKDIARKLMTSEENIKKILYRLNRLNRFNRLKTKSPRTVPGQN